MWQSGRSKPAGKSSSNRAKNSVSMKRVPAQVRIQNKEDSDPEVMEVRVVLNDFTPQQLSFFCPDRLGAGQEIAITLEYPKRIFLKAMVVSCAEVETSGRVISSFQGHFRVAAKLRFESPEAQANIAKFVEEIMSTHLNAGGSIPNAA